MRGERAEDWERGEKRDREKEKINRLVFAQFFPQLLPKVKQLVMGCLVNGKICQKQSKFHELTNIGEIRKDHILMLRFTAEPVPTGEGTGTVELGDCRKAESLQLTDM